jgi:hypothetical protein
VNVSSLLLGIEESQLLGQEWVGPPALILDGLEMGSHVANFNHEIPSISRHRKRWALDNIRNFTLYRVTTSLAQKLGTSYLGMNLKLPSISERRHSYIDLISRHIFPGT